MTQTATNPATATLYERIGGRDKLHDMIGQAVDAHLANPAIRTRFEPFDKQTMIDGAFHFFAQAMGGPVVYEGRGLVTTHRGMNISEAEFVAAVDDILSVLQKNGVGQQEQLEVLGALYAWKDEVVHL